MIGRRFVAMLAPALLLARCGGPAPKPPPVLALTMIGGSEQNPDTAGRPAPVAVRIYQLTQTAKFERADVFALTEREQQTLGSDSAGSQELVLSPGETLDRTFELRAGVQAVGIVVLYRDIDSAKWREVVPVAASGVTKLTLTVGRLAITLKPA